MIKFSEAIAATLNALNTIPGQLPTEYFYLFDKVAFFLLKFKDDVHVSQWTELCHQLVRKCPKARNEELLFQYRQKVIALKEQITGAHLPKLCFILSRSQFHFEEILYRDLI